MESNLNHKEELINSNYEIEYSKIVNTFNNSVIVKSEWNKQGDTFSKFSMYDSSYIPVLTLGSTKIIN